MISLDFLLAVALKGLIVLAVTGLVATIFRGAAAAIRHLIWCAGLAAALVIPVAMAVLPEWTIFGPRVFSSTSSKPPEATVNEQQATAQATPITAPGSGNSPSLTEETGSKARVTARHSGAPATSGDDRMILTSLALGGWSIGFVLTIGWLVSGRFGIRRVRRAAGEVQSAAWVETIWAALSERSPAARPVTFLESNDVTTPYSWGIFRPVVLLPSVGASWPSSQRRSVVIHELAHVDRHDASSHLMGRLACAVHWFNPLTWIAARQARLAREQACDDTVLASGVTASEYASQLLVTAHLDTRGVLRGALPMTRRTQLGDRLAWILDAGRPRPRRSLSGAAVTAAVLAGVALGTPLGSLRHQERHVIRDSAGIRIVTSHAPIWNRSSWEVVAKPEVDVGVGGREEQLLHLVGGALTLADGRIVLANGSTRQLWVYDSKGNYLDAWGRNGDGPGEYRGQLELRRGSNGTLLVYDMGNGRVTTIDTAGKFLGRTGMLPGIDVRAIKDIPFGKGEILKKGTITGTYPGHFLGQASNGDLLIAGRGSRITVADEEIPLAIVPINEPVVRVSPNGKLRDTVGMFVTGQYLGTYASYGPGGREKDDAPFARTPRILLRNDLLYYGSGNEYEIRVYSVEGKLTRIIRRSVKPQPVTERLIQDYKKEFRRQRETARAEAVRRNGGKPIGPSDLEFRDLLNRQLDAMAFPATLPVFNAMQLDELGNLWVRDYQLPGDSAPSKWTVFDSVGRWLGNVTTPPRLSIYEIDTTGVLVLWRNEDDVEHVRRYALKR